MSKLSVDRDAAVDAYAEVPRRYPSSPLRDDAFIAAARLTTDAARGRAFVDGVLAMKGSEFRDEAQALKATRFGDAAVAEAKKQALARKHAHGGAPRRFAAADATASRPDDERRDEEIVVPATGDAPPAMPPSTVTTNGSTTVSTAVATAATATGPASTATTTPTMASAFARLQGLPAAPATTTGTATVSAAPSAQTSAPAPTPTAAAAATPEATPTAPTMQLDQGDGARVTMRPVAVLPDRPPPGTPSRKVMVVRHEKTASESSVRLRISGEVGVLRGEAPATAHVGRRIFYDVAPARLGQRNVAPLEVHDGSIARVRAGQYDVDVVRFVVELEGRAEPALSVTRKPFELVLSSPLSVRADVVAGAAPATASAPPPSADEVKERIGASIGVPGAPGGVSISQQLGLKVHRVVIDAGHGGHDTGALGPTGVREKDVTLQIAQRIRDKLNTELPEVEVIMTRDDDRTLALQDRTNVSNAAAADLFISVHCNASPSRRVRGVETYYLNITHDKYEMKLAARENAELGEGSISDLDFILADLAMKSNVDDSVRLGRAVQKAIVTKLHKTWPDVPDLGLKHALFYVLMGNRMPSILVETSFLSNKQEEKRLASAEYQDQIAEGVVDGVRVFVQERQAFFAAP
ncbi:MAG: N-acetylmuramoyl-L-alanine amidase [Deltaproteobacteria bacterium]|nr:N-acetylmuramoyl-L-alanine amidase [Deltaproteobacteria bacterium]